MIMIVIMIVIIMIIIMIVMIITSIDRIYQQLLYRHCTAPVAPVATITAPRSLGAAFDGLKNICSSPIRISALPPTVKNSNGWGGSGILGLWGARWGLWGLWGAGQNK